MRFITNVASNFECLSSLILKMRVSKLRDTSTAKLMHCGLLCPFNYIQGTQTLQNDYLDKVRVPGYTFPRIMNITNFQSELSGAFT